MASKEEHLAGVAPPAERSLWTRSEVALGRDWRAA